MKNNVYQLHDRVERSREAGIWIARLDRGLSDGEANALRTWLAADPRNEAELYELATLWDSMDSLSLIAEVIPQTAPQRAVPARTLAAIVASVVVVVVASLWAVIHDPGLGSYETSVLDGEESATYVTRVGSISTVDLSDGSRLTLNTDTTARVQYGKRQRLIHLESGELHVKVAMDAERPLRVIAGDRIVEAVGTAFSVKLNDFSESLEILVNEGAVGVRARSPDFKENNVTSHVEQIALSKSSLLVSDKQQLIVNAAGDNLKNIAPEEVEARLSWRQGNLVFQGHSLGEAVAEVARYTDMEFVFLSEDMREVRVAGLFKAGDVSGFLSTLRANFDIDHEEVDDGTVLLKPSELSTTL